jgi:cation:H+ antiporter
MPMWPYGNIVGSNIFNVFIVLGATFIIQLIDMPPQIASFDVWMMLGATAPLAYFAITGAKLQRWEGWVFLTSCAAYKGCLNSMD